MFTANTRSSGGSKLRRRSGCEKVGERIELVSTGGGATNGFRTWRRGEKRAYLILYRHSSRHLVKWKKNAPHQGHVRRKSAKERIRPGGARDTLNAPFRCASLSGGTTQSEKSRWVWKKCFLATWNNLVALLEQSFRAEREIRIPSNKI